MSKSTNTSIRQYRANEASISLVNLFKVPSVEHYLIVPLDLIELVIEVLKSRQYVYKTATRTNDMIVAVQYSRS